MSIRRQKFLAIRTVFPVAVFAIIFTLALRQSSTLDPDLWWHLQTAKDIVANRSIPHVDSYSFTRTGAEWITHEWLTELFMYGIYRFTGLGGLVLIFSAIVTGAFFFVYRISAGRPYVAGLAVLLAALASTPLFGVRAQMITLLLASVFIVILWSYEQNGRSRTLWWLPLLMLLWVNLHGGYALGFALIALFLISAVLDRDWRLTRSLVISGVACAVIAPLNPNGFRIFTYPIQTLTSPSMAALIDEWSSPDFHQAMFLPLAAFLFLLFAVLALSPNRPRLGELFLLVVMAFGALRSARHVPIFALVAVPFFADHLWELMGVRGWNKGLEREEPATAGKLILGFIVLMTSLAFPIGLFRHFVSHQPAYVAKRNPVAAVEFIEARHVPGPIFNKYGWGGYLIFRLYPDYRVFADGRADVYGDEFLFQMVDTYDGHPGWRAPLDRYGVRTVLIPPDASLASLLQIDREWRKVYEDNQAVIFTR